MATKRPQRRFQCSVCRLGPSDNVSVYRVTAARDWRCWLHLTDKERAACIR